MRALYAVMMVGAVVITARGVPAMMGILNRVRRQTPERQQKEKLIYEARRLHPSGGYPSHVW